MKDDLKSIELMTCCQCVLLSHFRAVRSPPYEFELNEPNTGLIGAVILEHFDSCRSQIEHED